MLMMMTIEDVMIYDGLIRKSRDNINFNFDDQNKLMVLDLDRNSQV